MSLMYGGAATLKRLHVKRPSGSKHIVLPNQCASGLSEDEFISRHTRFGGNKLPSFPLCHVARAQVNGIQKIQWPGKGVEWRGISATNPA